MYEHRATPLISSRQFILRMFAHALAAVSLLVGSLLLGMVGYMYFEQLLWRDAFLNAAMLLGGMGPVHMPLTAGGKLFAGCYALYAGLVFIVTAGVILAPTLHRVLHRYHWDEQA